MTSKVAVSRQVNSLLEQEQWARARALLEKQLVKSPEDHWLLTRIGTTYYEEGKYETALEYASRARTLAPRCPLVLWDYAGALDMLGRFNEALDVYKVFINDWPATVLEECNEGEEWGMSLLTDVLYRIGVCASRIGKKQAAEFFFRSHLRLVAMGNASIYPAEEVQREMEALGLPRKEAVEEELEHAREQLALLA